MNEFDPVGRGAAIPSAWQAEQAARLPGLLQVVRSRPRRRLAKRGAALGAVALVAAAGFGALPGPASGPAPASPLVPPAAALPAWTVVGDDPAVVARITVATAAMADCYIGDAELQALLQSAARPAGLVRLPGRVLVDSAAIDPIAVADGP